MHVSGWGNATWWPGPSVWVSLCCTCRKLVAHSCEALKMPPFLPLLISQPVKGIPRVRDALFFHSSLPGVQVPSWFLFFFFFFHLAQPHGWSFLQFWLYEICQHSVGILWNCFPCRCVFDVWVGSKIHIFLSTILISPETNIFDLSHMRSDFLASVHDLLITCLHRISQASCLCRFPNQRKESKLFWQ